MGSPQTLCNMRRGGKTIIPPSCYSGGGVQACIAHDAVTFSERKAKRMPFKAARHPCHCGQRDRREDALRTLIVYGPCGAGAGCSERLPLGARARFRLRVYRRLPVPKAEEVRGHPSAGVTVDAGSVHPQGTRGVLLPPGTLIAGKNLRQCQQSSSGGSPPARAGL